MRVVIVGASKFGTATARELLDGGHEVVLVDTDRRKLEELEDELDCGMLHGDGSLPSVQRDAFGDHADALVLLTNNDDVNIVAAAVGESVGFARVVPQILRAELLSVCEELGLDDLITPHATIGQSIVRVLENNDDAELALRFRKGLRVVGHQVPASLDCTTVGDLDLPDQCRAIGVARGEEDSIVADDTVLSEGDRLIVLADDSAQDDLAKLFETEPQNGKDEESD